MSITQQVLSGCLCGTFMYLYTASELFVGWRERMSRAPSTRALMCAGARVSTTRRLLLGATDSGEGRRSSREFGEPIAGMESKKAGARWKTGQQLSEQQECGTGVLDIEAVVPHDIDRWTNYKPPEADATLKPYVMALNTDLERRRDEQGGLTLKDFSYSTSAVLKNFRDPVNRSKSKLIHVYRALVKEGKIEHDQSIENLLIKKLGKSTFGGINVSVFIPPGHSAPLWDVTISKVAQNEYELRVISSGSGTYSLAQYAGYTDMKQGVTASVNGLCEVTAVESEVLRFTVRRNPTYKLAGHIFDLELDGGLPVWSADASQAFSPCQGMLKGSRAVTTCTFQCVYCPTEKRKNGEPANPKSYLTHEPGVLRAVRNRYDTVSQVYDRVTGLLQMGHDVSKVFVRCVGGTWSVVTRNGQETFIRDILYALNTVMTPLSRPRKTLAEEQIINETSPCRAVEICVEDHPKMVSTASLIWARQLGITALEMGVQTTDDKIHAITKRDSTRAQLIDRAALSKDFGFKVLAHVMPDLPGSTPEIDKRVIEDILEGTERIRIRNLTWVAPALSAGCALLLALYAVYAPAAVAHGNALPVAGAVLLVGAWLAGRALDARLGHVDSFLFDYDRFKLYPTMVLEFSELKQWYLDGKYTPYWERLGKEALYDVIQHFMERVKPYQRVERIMRDVPAAKQKNRPNYVVGGIDVTNAQQIVEARMTKKCVCLRTREIRNNARDPSLAKMFETQYHANRGREYFLSFETPDREFVYGFLKLRFNDGPGRKRQRQQLPAELQGAAIIRWLQVYGRAVAIGGGRKARSSQHLGFGRRLMARAEEIARREGVSKIADISGIGVREYYRHLGYKLEGTYMVKHL